MGLWRVSKSSTAFYRSLTIVDHRPFAKLARGQRAFLEWFHGLSKKVPSPWFCALWSASNVVGLIGGWYCEEFMFMVRGLGLRV